MSVYKALSKLGKILRLMYALMYKVDYYNSYTHWSLHNLNDTLLNKYDQYIL